jgi:hypothetical protein
MSIERNYQDFNGQADQIMRDIQVKLDGLTDKLKSQPKYEYKQHCLFIREQVEISTNDAIAQINECRLRILNEIDVYEQKCAEIAEEELQKKIYLQELIDKGNKKLTEWKNCMSLADRAEKFRADE